MAAKTTWLRRRPHAAAEPLQLLAGVTTANVTGSGPGSTSSATASEVTSTAARAPARARGLTPADGSPAGSGASRLGS